MTRLRADFLLLTAALIWGTAFVAQKVGNGMIGPILFVAGRFTLSALLLIPLAWREARNADAPLTRRDWMLAGTIGVVLCALAALQQIGLTITSVTNAGFITSLYIAFVPFVGWLIVRAAIRPLVLGGVAVSLLGAWLLAGHGQPGGLSFGDILVLISAIITSLHIVLVSLFLKSVHRPFFLSFMQYSVTAVLAGVIGFSVETTNWQLAQGALPTILYAGLLSGGVGFTLQIVAQRYTPATEAALIMSLESVFAAIAAAILLGERLTMTAAAGCGLVLLGVVMVEVVPLIPGRGPSSDKLPPLGSVPLD